MQGVGKSILAEAALAVWYAMTGSKYNIELGDTWKVTVRWTFPNSLSVDETRNETYQLRVDAVPLHGTNIMVNGKWVDKHDFIENQTKSSILQHETEHGSIAQMFFPEYIGKTGGQKPNKPSWSPAWFEREELATA